MARLSFRCEEELVAAVDRLRGDVPRERWLRKVVERALGEPVRAGQDAERALESTDSVASALGSSAPAEQPDYIEGPVTVRYSPAHAENCKCPVCSS